MTLRIGILGASRIAGLAIVEPARELGHRLVAVAARDRDRARHFAHKHGVERVLGTYDEVLHDPEVDVVYNPLANALHAPWNLAAVRAGKPVLAEKPYARNAAEAVEVTTAAEAAGVPVVEGFHYLYHPVTRRLLNLIADGRLGTLRDIEVRMEMPAPADDDPRWSLELAGGSVMDLGCYGLHFIRTVGTLVGTLPRITSARMTERDPGVDATSEISLRLGEAGARSLNSMVATDFHFSIRVTGSAGEALAHNFIKPHEDDRLTLVSSDATVTSDATHVERLGTRTSYTYQLEAFAAHVLGGEPLPVDNADAVANMTLIDETYRAAGLAAR